MFTESAEFYDAIYFQFKDYAAEAAEIAREIRSRVPAARSVLDVACGTGEHARLLEQRHGFVVDGLDLNAEFLRLARKKSPGASFHRADMRSFSLDKRFDAVICMFSSIGYAVTLPGVEEALRCFARHVAPGGVVLVEPWFPPGYLEPGHVSSRRVQVGDTRVTRTSRTTLEDGVSRLTFDYLIEEPGRTRSAIEDHVLGLFTDDEMRQAFRAAGLDAERTPGLPGSDRGLYVARPSGESGRKLE